MANRTAKPKKLSEACWAFRLKLSKDSKQPTVFHSEMWNVVRLFATRKDAYEYRDGYGPAYRERLSLVRVDVVEKG